MDFALVLSKAICLLTTSCRGFFCLADDLFKGGAAMNGRQIQDFASSHENRNRQEVAD